MLPLPHVVIQKKYYQKLPQRKIFGKNLKSDKNGKMEKFI